MNAPSAITEQAWRFVVLPGKALEDCLNLDASTPKGAPVAGRPRGGALNIAFIGYGQGGGPLADHTWCGRC